MGTGASNLVVTDSDGLSCLGDLPDTSISEFFMNLDPLEICKFARVDRTFHRASMADFVWEKKLPSNYKFLVDKLVDQELDKLTNKKEIYTRLCKPNRFDNGTKVVWLDKSSGKMCLSISPKGLKITGINDRRYWKYIPSDESKFDSVAYLQQIWWFEAAGELDFEFPIGTYSLFFKVKLGRDLKRFGRRICAVDQVHGWNIKPVRFKLSTSDGQQSVSECYLCEPGNWVHYHAGDIVVENPKMPLKIKFSMVQIDCTHTKGGLCLDSVIICPSEFRERLDKF